jgi:hypothetical protein
VVNVNDAVMPNAPYYVGNVQKDNGVRVAKWFIEHHPQGGKVAVIEGQPGVYAAGQRTSGFKRRCRPMANSILSPACRRTGVANRRLMPPQPFYSSIPI